MILTLTREPRNQPPAPNGLVTIGRLALLQLREMGRAGTMLLLACFEIRGIFRRRARRETMIQMYIMGIKSLGVITTVAIFIGMILALQTGMELRRWNQEMYIGAGICGPTYQEMFPELKDLE